MWWTLVLLMLPLPGAEEASKESKGGSRASFPSKILVLARHQRLLGLFSSPRTLLFVQRTYNGPRLVGAKRTNLLFFFLKSLSF